MIVSSLNRHLYVCGRKEVQPILNRDKKFWNIISIREPTNPSPTYFGAKKIRKLAFYDIENLDDPDVAGLRLPCEKSFVLNFSGFDVGQYNAGPPIGLLDQLC